MIIDSPIISGSYLSTGSLSQTGNVSITGSLTATAGISGSFSGSGANLFGIPASGITGLNLSQISSGSVSASISPNLGLLINTSVSASNFTGSFSGSLTGIATSASYASFALTSSYSLGGSGFPFSGSAVITGSLIVSGSGLTITGSVAISSLTTGSGVRYVIADQNGLLSAQTASAAIFTTQQVVSTAGQTSFPITNGYSTGYVTVFVNGTKLSADEYVDTSGTNIIFLTGSNSGDVVEFQKYLPAAGVSNNTLRTVNYFTTTLGQTNFNVNYTPGLLDVFYNGAKLDNTEYTAANGTSITLATGSNAGDKLEVDVYSYQVGAFSGIGGTGAANQLAYFNTSNSITGSNAFTVSGSAIIITGSLIVSGSGTLINIGPAVFSGSVTAVGGFSGSFSGNADSASLAQNSLLLQGTGSIGFATTASLLAVSSSQQQISSSLLNVIANYATTGSNSFRANQSITGSLVVSSTITAQTLVVQTVTSSIVYSSGSNLFGNQLSNTQTFTGSIYQTGSIAAFAGSVGIGTTSPQASLDIAGKADTTALRIGASNGYEIFITGSDSANIYHASPNQAIYLNTNGGALYLGPSAASTLLTITGSNVGIATTNPYVKLDVRGGGIGQTTTDFVASSAGTVIYMRTGATTGNTTYGAIQVGNTGDTTGGNLALNQYGGNVGIGTTSPAATLQVRGPNEVGTFFDAQNVGAGGAVFSRINASSSPYNQYVFNNGYVGIGVTSPQSILHISNGEIVFTETGFSTVRLHKISHGHSDGSSPNNFLGFQVSDGSGNTAERMRINGSGYVGIGRTPLAQLAVLGGPVQIMQDYPGHQTIIRSTGASGGYNGQLTITIPEMAGAGSSQGFGGYSCEVYVSGYSGLYCHAWFSGYINNGLVGGEATILRSSGGWSLSQAASGTYNQGFQFVVDYPAGLTHPTARIIFNKGGDPNIAEYPANSITAVFS